MAEFNANNDISNTEVAYLSSSSGISNTVFFDNFEEIKLVSSNNALILSNTVFFDNFEKIKLVSSNNALILSNTAFFANIISYENLIVSNTVTIDAGTMLGNVKKQYWRN